MLKLFRRFCGPNLVYLQSSLHLSRKIWLSEDELKDKLNYFNSIVGETSISILPTDTLSKTHSHLFKTIQVKSLHAHNQTQSITR